MTIAKVDVYCDRCGAKIDGALFAEVQATVRRTLNGEESSKSIPEHLCQRCAMAFRDFMREETGVAPEEG